MMNTASFGNEVTWNINDYYTGEQICRGGNYTDYVNTTSDDCNLIEGEYYEYECRDSYDDGWGGGYLMVGD